jgi:hypothetical protein
MRVLRKTNDVRVSAKFLDALRRHLYKVIETMCLADGNEKRVTKFHAKIRKNVGPGGLVRESAVREIIVEVRGGPTQVSKGVLPQIDAYAAAVCRASVDAAGSRMTVTDVAPVTDAGRLAVLDRGEKRSPDTQRRPNESNAVDRKERRHISAKYAVTLQGTTLQGTMPYVTAYGDAKLKKAITRDIRRFFDHLGLHGSVEVDVYAIEVRG